MQPSPSETSPRSERLFVVESYNTIDIADGEVVRVRTPWSGNYYYQLLNLGPCTVYYREGREPYPGDEYSVTLPPFTADNLVVIPDGPDGLLIMAGPLCATTRLGPGSQMDLHPQSKVTLRLVRG